MGRIEKVNVDDIHQSPPQHESLGELVPAIRWQWRHLKNYATWCRSFEDWELGFLRDANPGREIAVWTKAAYTLTDYSHRHPTIDKHSVFEVLIAILLGTRDEAKDQDMVRELVGYIENSPSELFELENYTDDGHCLAVAEHLR